MAIIVQTLGGHAWVYKIKEGKGYILRPSGEWQGIVEGQACAFTTEFLLQLAGAVVKEENADSRERH